MDIQELWEKALKETEVVRPRVKELQTYSATQLPYIFLAGSSISPADTVVRKGEVWVEKPALILPSFSPQFEGFDFEKELHLNPGLLTNFLLIRGVRFPSLKYNNKTFSLDIHQGTIEKAVGYYLDRLQREEDVQTGLISGPEDCWQLSLLIFICSQVLRSADSDMHKLLEDYQKKHKRKSH